MKSSQTEIRIDRIEADFAVCIEGGISFRLAKSLLPVGVKEGDILTVTFQKNSQRRTQELYKTETLLQKLRKKHKRIT